MKFLDLIIFQGIISLYFLKPYDPCNIDRGMYENLLFAGHRKSRMKFSFIGLVEKGHKEYVMDNIFLRATRSTKVNGR